MKQLHGMEITVLTDDSIVMEENFTGIAADGKKYTVHASHKGCPSPPPDKHRELIDSLAKMLL